MEERKAAAFPPPPCPRRRAARAGAQFGFYYHGAALGRPKLAQPGRAPGCRCRPMRLTLTACQATDTGLSKVQLLRLGPHQNGDGGRPCHARRLAMALRTASKRHAGVRLPSLSPSPILLFPTRPAPLRARSSPGAAAREGAMLDAGRRMSRSRQERSAKRPLASPVRGGAAGRRRACAGSQKAKLRGGLRARSGAGAGRRSAGGGRRAGTPVLHYSYRAAPTHRHV